MNKPTVVAPLLLIALIASTAMAETIELTGDASVTGEILKSDATSVVVDLGVTVLRIPRSKISRIIDTEPAAAETATTPDRPSDPAAGGWRLYSTGSWGSASIEKNVGRVGEAVVMVTSPGGQGSGFIISPDGYCITNYHVIARETRIKTTVFRVNDTGFEPKHYKKVKIVAMNPFLDLALLKIDGEGDRFKTVPLGAIDDVDTGQRVFAVGNPLGLTRTVSQGIVSTTNRNMDGRLYIQTTTDINPGNSGGPLFNLSGEVLGVTSMGYLHLGGLNFAIPIDVVKRFITNRDAFAYDEDNPNTGHRYLQPAGRQDTGAPDPGRVPTLRTETTDAATTTKE